MNRLWRAAGQHLLLSICALVVSATLFGMAPGGPIRHRHDVEGLIEVLEVETDGHELHVIELVVLRNELQPPRTLNESLPLQLPIEAELVQALAATGGDEPQPISSRKESRAGEYRVTLSLKPGDTKLQIAYQLPYFGNLKFRTRVPIPMDEFAVRVPQGIKLQGETSVLNPAPDAPGWNAFVAKRVLPGQQIVFTVSGFAAVTSPVVGGHLEDRKAGSLSQNRRIFATVAAAILLALILFWLKLRRGRPAVGENGAQLSPAMLKIKEDLFRLEIDHHEGKISAHEYVRLKEVKRLALRKVLKDRGLLGK